jgi:hypothetical protein
MQFRVMGHITAWVEDYEGNNTSPSLQSPLANSWSRSCTADVTEPVLLEKLAIPQMFRLYRNRNYVSSFTASHHWTKLIQSTVSLLILSSSILSCLITPASPKWFFLYSDFQTELFITFLISPIRATSLDYLSLLHYVTLIVSAGAYRTSICRSIHRHAVPLRSKYSAQNHHFTPPQSLHLMCERNIKPTYNQNKLYHFCLNFTFIDCREEDRRFSAQCLHEFSEFNSLLISSCK